MKKILPAFLMLFFAIPLWADWTTEEVKINYLLNEIAQVDGVFIRNGTNHQPEKAVSHLRMKLKRAMNSWFAPDKKEWTAKMFIEKLASKSSLSGKPYQIQLNDGRLVNSADWLFEKLNRFPNSP